jgi:hypothetical protein
LARRIANGLLREIPEDEEEEQEEEEGDEEEDEEEREGYSESRPTVSENCLSHSAQADLFEGIRNSITLPLTCGGSHFTRFEKLVGM